MKILNKNTDYAVRALLFLGLNKGKYVSARRISESQNIPYQFLRRILSRLIENKLIVSKEGIGGGVRIAKPPSEIKVKGIIEAFQGSIQLSECMFRKKVCANRSTCVLRNEISKIEKKVSSEFDRITIGSLVKKLKKGSPKPRRV